jgi:hypothetical protein
MATSNKKPAAPKKAPGKAVSSTNNNLETDMPLSEKDEVKKAEQNTASSAKKST